MVDKELLRMLTDRCKKDGDKPGFEFEIKCPSCNKAWLSPFKPFSQGGVGLGLAKLFKSSPQQPAPNDPGEMAWNQEKATAFKEAAETFEGHFVYCKKCEKFVCKRCWNSVREWCIACCAGAAAVAMDEALRESHRMLAGEANCPKCNAVGKQGKFCGVCGTKIPAKDMCPKCGARVPSTAAFCAECGTKVKN